MLTANLLANAIVAGVFLTMLHSFGGAGTFAVFGVLAVAGFALVYRFAPETKGRQLEEIRHFWENDGRWPDELPSTDNGCAGMALIAAGTVVLPQGVCRPGWVETSGGRIVGCGVGPAASAGRSRHARRAGGARLRRHACARRGRRVIHRRQRRRYPARGNVSPPAWHDHHAGQPGHGVARRAAHGGACARRIDPRGHRRRYPSGGAVAKRGALRGARSCAAARPGARRDRRSAGRRRRRDPDGHPGTRTHRQRRGDYPLHRCRSGCRRWTYGRDVRADPPGRRAGRDGRHAPVQRNAAGAPPRARTGARVAARIRG